MRRFKTPVVLVAAAAMAAAAICVPALAAENVKPHVDKDLKLQVPPPAGWQPEVVRLTAYTPTANEVLTAPENMKGLAVAKTPPAVDFAILPGQWRGGALWSTWGDSLYASDGNFYCSIGNHHGPYGTAMIYRVDPRKRTAEMVVDFTEALGTSYDPNSQEPYAPGKIHGPLLEADGWIYFAGYRGAIKYTTRKEGYKGDHFMRYSIATGKVENLGVPIEDCTHAIYRIHAPTMRLYGLSQPSKEIVETIQPRLYVLDLKTTKPVYYDSDCPVPNVSRAFIFTDDGRAYFSTYLPPEPKVLAEWERKVAEIKKTVKAARKQRTLLQKLGPKPTGPAVLAKYDPKTNKVVLTNVKVPDDAMLRTTSRMTSDGIVYCLTSKGGYLFAVDTNNDTLKEYGRIVPKGVDAYTAVMRLDPKERYLYCVPGSHGHSDTSGSAVIQIDVKTGKKKVIAFLNGFIRDRESYNLGGTFGTALSADGQILHICWNGRSFDKQVSKGSGSSLGFGLCSVLNVHIPASER